VARVEAIDAEVIATLADDVLRPTEIDQAVALAFEELAPAGSDRSRRQLEAELAKVTEECGRLAEAIGRGGRLSALLDRLTRQGLLAEALRAELAACPAAAPTFDRKALEQRLHVKLADWRGLLTRNVATGNAMLRTLLAEPIRFTPVLEERRRGYRFEGRLALDRMVTGLVPLPEVSAKLHQLMASPEGFDASACCRLPVEAWLTCGRREPDQTAHTGAGRSRPPNSPPLPRHAEWPLPAPRRTEHGA